MEIGGIGMKKILLIMVFIMIFSCMTTLAETTAEQINEWKAACEQNGDPVAALNVGNCYFLGDGVEQDDAEAVRWYTISAEGGDAAGQCSLGRMFYYGRGVEQNYEEAAGWFRLSADQGLAEAQYNLACLYEAGEGVEQSYEEAAKWYRLSADQGYVYAQYNLGMLYCSGDGVEQNFEEAAKLFRPAAENGHANAQYCLASCYYYGDGVEADVEEAVKWYTLAAEQGHESAIEQLNKIASAEPTATPEPEGIWSACCDGVYEFCLPEDAQKAELTQQLTDNGVVEMYESKIGVVAVKHIAGSTHAETYAQLALLYGDDKLLVTHINAVPVVIYLDKMSISFYVPDADDTGVYFLLGATDDQDNLDDLTKVFFSLRRAQ